MNAWPMRGIAGFASFIDAAGRSPAGPFVRRHRERLVADCIVAPAVALLSATTGALDVVPDGPPFGASGPVLAAVVAGALAMSSRLRLEMPILAHAVGSAARFLLAALGAAAAGAVLFWDRLGPVPPWTLDEAVAHLRAVAPATLSCLLVLWLMCCAVRFVCLGARSGDLRRAQWFDRRLAARHEAAHALVASVLGLPMEGAWVLHGWDKHGVGGTVRLARPAACTTAETVHDLIVRRVAMNVAGVVGERDDRSIGEIVRRLETQHDWAEAGVMSWIGGSIRPGRVLLGDVLEAVVPALRAAPWRSAIAEAAEALLRAGGDPVSPEVFAAIARRFDLALTAVEALARA